MPRKQLLLPISPKKGYKKSTISQYFSTSSCAVCSQKAQEGLCEDCQNKPQTSMVVLREKMRTWEHSFLDTSLVSCFQFWLIISNCYHLLQVCSTCSGEYLENSCVSLDCPILYRRIYFARKMEQVPYVREFIIDF